MNLYGLPGAKTSPQQLRDGILERNFMVLQEDKEAAVFTFMLFTTAWAFWQMVGRILCSRAISSSPKFHPMNEDSSFSDKLKITRFLCQLILDHPLTPEPQ